MCQITEHMEEEEEGIDFTVCPSCVFHYLFQQTTLNLHNNTRISQFGFNVFIKNITSY